MIAGLTRYVTKGHLARAVLEATAWQTREIADAMTKDSGVGLASLKVDGGMTSNDLLMQILSDVLGVPVVRPVVAETTCLGAAYAAGLAVGFWPDTDALRSNWRRAAEWTRAWTRRPATAGTGSGSRRSSGPWTGWRTRVGRHGRRRAGRWPGARARAVRRRAGARCPAGAPPGRGGLRRGPRVRGSAGGSGGSRAPTRTCASGCGRGP